MNETAQERQLVLTEALNKQLQNVLANQQQLNATTEELKKQNAELKKALEATRENQQQATTTRKRRRSSVDIPEVLRTRFKRIYGVLVNRGVIDEFYLDENVLSPANNAILMTMKEELRREHGSENCPWTDLEMEAQFRTYFKTRKERRFRITQGTNEQHKMKTKQNRRANAKLERRLTGLEILMPRLKEKNVTKMKEILDKQYMSSEESEYEEKEDNVSMKRTLTHYNVRKLTWERKKMKNMKKKMDNAYYQSLSRHARGMIKERKQGCDSTRPCPPGPEWAVRT